MDETAKLSHICPQQFNEQTESTDLTPNNIFLVVENTSNNKKSLRIVQVIPDRGEVISVGEIPFVLGPSVVSCAGSIFFLGDYFCTGIVYEFDLMKRTARTTTRLVEPAWWTSSAASSHEVIMSGGHVDEAVASCSVYAPATNRWTSLRQLRQARHSHQMCWLSDGRVFTIGGVCNEERLSSVEMLERAWIPTPRKEASAEWQNVAPLKKTRYNFGCCVVEGRIIVAGGRTDGGDFSSSVESFEPPTTTNIGQWTSLPDLASAVRFCFLIPSVAGLVLIVDVGKMQLGRQKAQVVSSSEWIWEHRPRLTSCACCVGLVSSKR